jgi:hypothetical protein
MVDVSEGIRERPPVLVYVANQKVAARLCNILGMHEFALKHIDDRHKFTEELRQNRYAAIVTNTAQIAEARKHARKPIINYEIFVHDRPDEDNRPRIHFDTAAFVQRIRFHVAD